MSNSILKSKLIALCWALLISLEDKKPLILLIDDYEILKCLNYTLLNANLRKHQNFDILFILSGLLHAFEKNVDPFDFYDSSAHIYLNSKLIVYLSSDLSLRDSFSLDVARCAAEMSACSVF